MDKLNFNEYKLNLSLNKVKSNIILFIIILIQSFSNSNDLITNKSMLGRKRNLENIRQETSSNINLELNDSSSNLNKNKSFSAPKITKELINLYNMKRSICMSCVKTKNKKYPTNKFIPCFPISISS